MVEASVDIINLKADRTYGYYMDATNLKEWIKIFEEAKKGDNPYLADISKLPNLNEILCDHKKQLDELKDKGYSPLSHFDKFAKANQAKEYRSIYNFLCCDAHNNIRSLISRHADINDDQSDYQLQFLAPINLDSIFHYIDSCIDILINSIVIVHKALESPMTSKAETLATQFSEIRKTWMA
jgi:hypothetical protein